MSTPSEHPQLKDLPLIPYLNEAGEIPPDFQKKIGVYAIFDQNNTLQFVSYSRDVYFSLKQHLVRKPHLCYGVKVQTIQRPSRAVLEEIQAAWLTENGETPAGNGAEKDQWNDPIDAKVSMTEEDKAAYEKTDDLGKIKLLKQVSRRVEAEILDQLKSRHLTMSIRFNPKMKEQGLLDLK